ncbi:MAG: antirestriction protein ArdA [Cohaesibacter sp.]|nr:antirestriction protein ArdA [Cohaesibacter sp.]
MNTPQIYIADLAAYNSGILHGQWIDATIELDDIHEAIANILNTSPISNAEEWAIHDYDDFGDLNFGEFPSLKQVQEIACFLQEHGKLGEEILNHNDLDMERSKQALDDGYVGQYESLADYAEQITTETADIPKHLEYYIDYEAMGRDMELNGDVYTVETGYQEVHIFWNH